MAKHPPLVQRLIDALRMLPSVGPKSAQRMAYQLLERQRGGALELAAALEKAMHEVGYCQQCRAFSQTPVCALCQDDMRHSAGRLCVVASSADLYAIEQTGQFDGLYYVLRGQLSPLDGIGPQELGLDSLEQRLRQGQINEVILATNPTVEGEATAFYIAELCRRYQISVSRLAQGMPVGGELEYLDGNTLAFALTGRKPI